MKTEEDQNGRGSKWKRMKVGESCSIHKIRRRIAVLSTMIYIWENLHECQFISFICYSKIV